MDHHHDYRHNPLAVVVAQFRNAMDWTEAMRSNPYSAPNHMNLPWYDFVTQPWTMPRYGEDVPFDNLTMAKANDQISCKNPCSSFKKPHEIIPCLANATFVVKWQEQQDKGKEQVVEEKDPPAATEIQSRTRTTTTTAFYEMQPNGLPYDNILALRSAKIHNFLSMQTFVHVKAFHVLLYEDLVNPKQHNGSDHNKGTAQLLEQLEHEFNVTRWDGCQPIVAGNSSHMTARPLSPDFVEYMNTNVDWKTEALLGYNPTQVMQ